MVTLSFPGLGIGEFSFNRVAFSLFGIEVRWYGIIITLAIIVGFLYAHKRSSFEGISTDDLLDYTIYTVIFSIIGARLYYVLTTLSVYDYKSFYDVIAIWNGGIAIYGAIIAGAATILVVSYIKKIKPTKVLDMVAPGVMIAQSIGRWGNFMNGEAFGTETDIFCRMGIKLAGWSKMYYVHPTFLYESLWNLSGFILINAFYKKKKYDGQIVLMYITWYGFGRMFIEGLRTDSLYFMQSVFGKTIRISQVVGALSFIVGAALLAVFGAKTHKKKLAEGTYERVYNFGETEKNMTDEPGEWADGAENNDKTEKMKITEESAEDENGKDN